jgi:peptidoglycan/LPS O-acetylase OafA/YrhL
MLYRKDIDGLRAIAVVPVVLFHADLNVFSGGFVGVDVFFVISGFLITSLIGAEIKKDVFTVTSFYERRIRRIFPALFVVTMFSYILAFSLFMPEQFLEFGKSVVAATLFSSNILFWLESGYFDGPAEMKPLLHTWSLAVEEQFYIIFPIFLILIKRYFNCRWIAFILPLALISFIMSVWGVYHQPSATFYLAPTRAWELLLGSLLALGLFPPIGNRMVREALSMWVWA